MVKIYPIHCPKCNNNYSFYRYSKDKSDFQKYLCWKCGYQFVSDTSGSKPSKPRQRPYPSCPICGKATFLHHRMEHYTNYRCCGKRCNHFFFVPKPTVVRTPSMSTLFGKTDFKRMRYPIHIILMALRMLYLGKNSFRDIALILQTTMNVQISHTTIGNWCTRFAPLFQNIAIRLIPALAFNSDEWHADETVFKIQGKKHYLWLIVDAETRLFLDSISRRTGIPHRLLHCLIPPNT